MFHIFQDQFLFFSEMSVQKLHEREVEQKPITQKGFVGQHALEHLIQHLMVFSEKDNYLLII